MAVRRPVVLASVLLSVALSVSACASNPPPAAAPSSGTAAPVASRTPASPTITSAPPTTTTAPVDPVLARIPKAARANTQEGAEAFTKFFMEQVSVGYFKADPTVLDDLYARACKTCVSFRDSMAAMRADGHHHESRSLIVGEARAYRFVEEDPKKIIGVPIKQKSVSIVDRRGTRVDTLDADELSFVLTLNWEGHWVVHLAQVEEY
jgi:hypothetical protein